jgi:predicted AAA+ superfamily ATPase
MILTDVLKRVILSQKQQLETEEKIVPRDIANKINLQNKFAVIISGIRRSGKSTLVKSIAKKIKTYNYINFEDPRLSGFELDDFERMEEALTDINGKNEYYFFDEIQIVEKWEFYIRGLLDKKKTIIITGSNASMLSKELGTKLTGRNLRYELYPFSYKEFLSFTDSKEGIDSFKDYMMTGGFPEYISMHYPKILQNLVGDSLIRDVAIRHKVRNTKQLTELAIYLISNTSKQFSYTSLKNTFGLGSTNSVSKYIGFLEESYLLFTLSKFDYSLKKQIVNDKKIYAIDTGIIINNSKTFTEDFGKLLENIIFIRLKSCSKEIFYYRDKRECDFLVRTGTKITHAYQACYYMDNTNKEREIQGLIEALKKFNLKEGTILTYNQQDKFIIDGKEINIIPTWKWLLMDEDSVDK